MAKRQVGLSNDWAVNCDTQRACIRKFTARSEIVGSFLDDKKQPIDRLAPGASSRFPASGLDGGFFLLAVLTPSSSLFLTPSSILTIDRLSSAVGEIKI